METIILADHPVLSSLYVKALFARKPGFKKGHALPGLEFACKGFRADAAKLAAYCNVTGLLQGDALPLLYPYVLTAPVQMSLLCSKQFPLRAMGLVHVRNRVLQHRPVLLNETMDARCTIGRTRVAKKGLEFDVETVIRVGDERVWECASTYLGRGRFGEEEEQPEGARLPTLENPDSEKQLWIPPDMGRRYARVSGDYNLIHVSSILAKFFGFPKAIIHGMWSAARCLAELPEQEFTTTGALSYLVAFKGPIPLGSQVVMKLKSGADRQQFETFCVGNDRPCVCGLLTADARL